MDVSVHHFGALQHTDYVREYLTVPMSGVFSQDITCRQHAAYFLQLQFQDWVAADDDWWSVTVSLKGPDGSTIGRRPALVYAHPYDVPTHAAFKTDHSGLFSLGLRTVAIG